jgi:hypothetical protein
VNGDDSQLSGGLSGDAGLGQNGGLGGVFSNPKPKRCRRPRAVKPPTPATVAPIVAEQTVEQRLAATKAKARKLSQEQKIRIPLRLAVSLETHESLVAIAEAVGPEKITDLAVHCMELGIVQMAGSQFKPRTSVTPLGRPAATNDEARARAAIEAAVVADTEVEAEIERERDEAAARLHLPGRKRAAAG